MSFPRRTQNNKKNSARQAHLTARNRGAVLPLVAILLFVGIAFVGFCTDVMRSAYASSAVRYGAEAAALGAFSSTLLAPGQTYSVSNAQDNIVAALNQAAAWNSAPYGPDTSSSGLAAVESAVHFDSSDISFVNNPNSADNDFFLQLRGKREGTDSLTLFFLPLLYAFNGGGGAVSMPPASQISQAHPQRLIEVVSQPATRIGAGAPHFGGDARSQELAGFATFPLAISNLQFATLADPTNVPLASYTIDIGGSANNGPVSAGHIRGALVNVTPSGGSLNYYGDVSGNLGLNQLNGCLNYFSIAPTINEIPPAVVENGSLLPAFDTSSAVFQQSQSAIITQFSKLALGRSYIFPVIAGNPVYGSVNKVIGFARLRVISWPSASSGNLSMQVQLEESIPLRNASFANGPASVPTNGAMMPAPVAPFLARTLTADGQGLSTRPRSVVMAPSLSPRFPLALPN